MAMLLHRGRWDGPDSDFTIFECTLWSDVPEEVHIRGRGERMRVGMVSTQGDERKG